MDNNIYMVDKNFEGTDEIYSDFYTCSSCGGYNLMDDFKYCPHCGGHLIWNLSPKPDYSIRRYSKKTFKDGTGW